jgi:hypothetical protein
VGAFRELQPVLSSTAPSGAHVTAPLAVLVATYSDFYMHRRTPSTNPHTQTTTHPPTPAPKAPGENDRYAMTPADAYRSRRCMSRPPRPPGGIHGELRQVAFR